MTGVLTTLLTTARLLSVPREWLRAEADSGRVPCLRAGPAYLFDVDLVESLLLERARQSADAHEAGEEVARAG